MGPMTVSVIGLVVEFLFFLLGVYVYLFARGFVQHGSDETRRRAEAFRQENGAWLRFLGLGLAAVMGLNLALHVGELMG